eukprot:TRINITY_DN2259_c0_g1_i1.p1 TRINITY_DN2259_c0_g1~~TRINITY_DN2259_c0_g1_i1.p1  ORF type:complete len:298 (-),score=75.09 TRINITY_DN2259_c0_g1_i1:27-920(-)
MVSIVLGVQLRGELLLSKEFNLVARHYVQQGQRENATPHRMRTTTTTTNTVITTTITTTTTTTCYDDQGISTPARAMSSGGEQWQSSHMPHASDLKRTRANTHEACADDVDEREVRKAVSWDPTDQKECSDVATPSAVASPEGVVGAFMLPANIQRRAALRHIITPQSAAANMDFSHLSPLYSHISRITQFSPCINVRLLFNSLSDAETNLLMSPVNGIGHREIGPSFVSLAWHKASQVQVNLWVCVTCFTSVEQARQVSDSAVLFSTFVTNRRRNPLNCDLISAGKLALLSLVNNW